MEINKIELEYRKQKEGEFRLEDERKKVEDRQSQQMYKDTLGYQTNITQKLKHNYGSMTE